MPFRVSFRKQQKVGKRLAGWSENFWSALTDLSACQDATIKLGQRLEALTGSQAYVSSYRISDVSNKRLVVNKATDYGPTNETPNVDGDYPTTALLLKLETNDPFIVRQWIRGLPDSITAHGGVFDPSLYPGYSDTLAALFTALTTGSNGWVLRVLDKNVKPVPISAINMQTGTVNCLGHGFGAAGKVTSVRLKGFSFPKTLNKVWQARVLDQDNFQLDFFSPTAQNLPAIAKKPTARNQVYTTTPIIKASIDRATSHYTGRPTDLLGSRHRTRRSTLVSVPAAPPSTGSQLVTVAG